MLIGPNSTAVLFKGAKKFHGQIYCLIEILYLGAKQCTVGIEKFFKINLKLQFFTIELVFIIDLIA